MFSTRNTLPKSIYAAKGLIKSLGLDYEMIHECHSNCILYWEKYEKINECPTCGESRWKVDAHSKNVHTGVFNLLSVAMYI